jgi:hypothetical protein
VIDVRTIHYGIRLTIVLLLTLAFYLGVGALFHQAVQLSALIALLFAAVGAERLWVFLEWIGPVVGTTNKKKQEQEQKQIVEYLLECSLRYGSPLVIAAIRSKKRLSLHVVWRFFRKSDIVLRRAGGYLLILMPFTALEQASIALKRLAARLPVRDVVVTDVSMLRALVDAQRASNNSEATVITARALRSICFQAFDVKLAHIETSGEQTAGPAIYKLYEAQAPDTLFDWSAALSDVEPAVDALPGAKDESASLAAL